MIEVEDQVAAQTLRKGHQRRVLVWFAAIALIGLLVGLMAGRLFNPLPAPDDHRLFWQVIEQPLGVDLLVRAPGDVVFHREEYDGAIRYVFAGVQLDVSPSVGRKVVGGKTLAWRFENRETGVQLLLVGLNTALKAEHQAVGSTAGRSGLQIALTLP